LSQKGKKRNPSIKGVPKATQTAGKKQGREKKKSNTHGTKGGTDRQVKVVVVEVAMVCIWWRRGSAKIEKQRQEENPREII